MKQLILMNKETGDICPAIRIQFFDHSVCEDIELVKFEGVSVSLRDNNSYDGWLLYSGTHDGSTKENAGPWMFVQKDVVDSKVEVLGEL